MISVCGTIGLAARLKLYQPGPCHALGSGADPAFGRMGGGGFYFYQPHPFMLHTCPGNQLCGRVIQIRRCLCAENCAEGRAAPYELKGGFATVGAHNNSMVQYNSLTPDICWPKVPNKLTCLEKMSDQKIYILRQCYVFSCCEKEKSNQFWVADVCHELNLMFNA